MTTGSQRWVVRFTGRVQGVGFRMTAVSQSRGLDVHGFVRNEPDGSVLMDVQGDAPILRQLVGRIETAMSGNVDGTSIDVRPVLDRASGFTIQY